MQDVSKLQKMKGKAAAELKRFAFIAAYLWVLLVVFEMHRYFVLRQVAPASLSGYRVGFAAINCLVLGKIIATGEILHLGQHTGRRALIVSVLLKSALFAALLVAFQVIEDVAKGLFRGESVAESFKIPGGDALGTIMLAVMVFVVLIPLFLFTTIQESIGREKLHSLMFERTADTTTKADAA
ncbi:MAG TPA: hypothetical protein VMU24_08870 [Candidatus Acidoferrales bacterium]|nr:hypothetical protein [Candidatus Acidoferrales bacterium]